MPQCKNITNNFYYVSILLLAIIIKYLKQISALGIYTAEKQILRKNHYNTEKDGNVSTCFPSETGVRARYFL